MRRGELGGRNLLKLFLLDAVLDLLLEAHVAARVHSWGKCVMVSVHFRDT